MYVKKSLNTQNPNKISFMEVAVDGIVDTVKTHEEEVQNLSQKKLSLDAEINNHKRLLDQLLLDKSELDAEITSLKLQNAVYQKDHINIRNAITVVKFQIKKIKESIAKAKANELKDLKDFEKTIDEITEKFRTSTDIYDRKVLSEKIKIECDKKANLMKELDDVKNAYEDFLKTKGLRAKKHINEELQSCILVDSELFYLAEMTETLEKVISDVKEEITGKEIIKK